MEAEALVARLRVQRVQAASDKVVQELERRANMLRERHRGITKKIEAIKSNLDEIRGLQDSQAESETPTVERDQRDLLAVEEREERYF